MGIIDRAGTRIRKIMARFPSETATITREGADEFGQASGVYTAVGTCAVWRDKIGKPSKVNMTAAGITTEDEALGSLWVCAMTPVPEVRHGDRIAIGNATFKIRNILHDSTDVRVFWQLDPM